MVQNAYPEKKKPTTRNGTWKRERKEKKEKNRNGRREEKKKHKIGKKMLFRVSELLTLNIQR